MVDKTLDVKGATCPIPLLKTRKALAQVPVGGTLEIFATDPGAPSDFEAYALQTGHQLIESTERDGVYRFVLRRAE